ncbi:MAG: polymer-forming cytoskeletal protein [Patescibacteria group bacterium]
MFPKDSGSAAYETANNRADEVETVVGPSVVVEGDFVSEGNILVKGTVSGSVKTARLLTVENTAKIMANVRAGDAVISGEVHGNIKVEQQLELTASSKVIGDISCQVLVVAAGAQLQGKISMKGLEGEEGGSGEKKRVSRPKNREEEPLNAEEI